MEDLYTKHADEFSATRKSPWSGWGRFSKNIVDHKIRVLDLGCGNGRFLQFLNSNPRIEIESYTGIDNSSGLLGIAKKNSENFNPSPEFLKFNLEEENWALGGRKYNVITAFGLIHHIHTYTQRRMFFENVFNLLEDGGIFCISFWQFALNQKLIDKCTKLSTENDYSMSFGNKGATRFVHFADKKEIVELERGLGFRLIDEYYSDGLDDDLNLYKIYQK